MGRDTAVILDSAGEKMSLSSRLELLTCKYAASASDDNSDMDESFPEVLNVNDVEMLSFGETANFRTKVITRMHKVGGV